MRTFIIFAVSFLLLCRAKNLLVEVEKSKPQVENKVSSTKPTPKNIESRDKNISNKNEGDLGKKYQGKNGEARLEAIEAEVRELKRGQEIIAKRVEGIEHMTADEFKQFKFYLDDLFDGLKPDEEEPGTGTGDSGKNRLFNYRYNRGLIPNSWWPDEPEPGTGKSKNRSIVPCEFIKKRDCRHYSHCKICKKGKRGRRGRRGRGRG